MQTNRVTVLIQQFNETLDKWIGYLDSYDLEMLSRQPMPGSWSLGQVYVHIIGETKHFIGQMKLTLLNTSNADGEMHHDAKKMFADNSFPDMQLHAPTNAHTPQPGSKAELLDGLLSIQKEVSQLYKDFDDHKPGGKSEHPGLWFFSSLDWLQFAEMHMRHHLRQKERIDLVIIG